MSAIEDSDTDARSWRTRVGAVLVPAAFLVTWYLPLPLDAPAQRLAAILAAVVVAWLTEVIPIPVTALLIAPAMVAAGITDAKKAFAPYADPLLFLFYGSFFIAAAMSRHGLDRRLAGWLFGSRLVAGIDARVRTASVVASVALSMWISNTAATAILVPILLGATMVQVNEDAAAKKRTAGHLMAVAYACSVGGIGTLVGTAPNLITARLLAETGNPFGFVRWMAIGLPIAVGLAIATQITLGWFDPPRASPTLPTARLEPGAKSTPWSRGERAVAWSFGVAVLGWVLPSALAVAGSPLGPVLEGRLPEGAVAIVAASLLFVLRERPSGQPVLPWREALKVDWGLIMLFGGGISLGSQMFETGLARALGEGFLTVTGVRDVWVLTALLIAFTIAFSEICSNTATATMLVPIVLGITTTLGVSPIAPVLAVGMAATCGFALPVSTGPNAIVYGTGRVPFATMVKVGLVLDVVSGIVLWILLRVLCPLYGWA
jgi:sodium-dependent dicarboxylate transporter 2/3/5